MPSINGRSALSIWGWGTVGSVALSFVVLLPLGMAGYKILLRYWLLFWLPGSIGSGIAALVATRPSKQGVLNSLNQSAEALNQSAQTLNQSATALTTTSETFVQSTETILSSVEQSSQQITQLAADTEEFATQFQQLYDALYPQQQENLSRGSHSAALPLDTSVPNSRVYPPTPPRQPIQRTATPTAPPGQIPNFNEIGSESELNLNFDNDRSWGNSSSNQQPASRNAS